MRYYLFLDESGDHGLSKIDPSFPVFVLCGIIISDVDYIKLRNDLNHIKQHFWGDKKVIFHSRDIRKCDEEFSILLDYAIKQQFYAMLNKAIAENNYAIISSIINKPSYIKKYGKKKNDVYEVALSFVVERSVFYLDSLPDKKQIQYIIEKRGRVEDNKLKSHFLRVCDVGTYYVETARIKEYKFGIHFRDKLQNINGLQLSDLIAYPIARWVMDPKRANPSFEIFESKIYSKGSRKFGLKVFP